MIYHKVCALIYCGKRFDTAMERKLYCCNNHYIIGNRMRAAARIKNNRINGKHKCPMCKLMKSTEKNRYCLSCRQKITKYEISDNCLGYQVIL
jgi:hypothetical protein